VGAARRQARQLLIGLIADTHGLVRPGCYSALEGCLLILHAGDVGGRHVLDELSVIAPVLAVAGNTDDNDVLRLPWSLERTVGGLTISLSHGHEAGRPTPSVLLSRSTADIVVFGPTHPPVVHRDGHRLAVNPGAAGPSRFGLRPSLARLSLRKTGADVEVVPLA
jgi:putative phosphoesterase